MNHDDRHYYHCQTEREAGSCGVQNTTLTPLSGFLPSGMGQAAAAPLQGKINFDKLDRSPCVDAKIFPQLGKTVGVVFGSD